MRKNSLIYPYFCYLKDYLENNRLLADVNGNTLRIHHYYPYGVEIGSVRVIGGNGVGPGDGASPQGGGLDGSELIDGRGVPAAQTSIRSHTVSPGRDTLNARDFPFTTSEQSGTNHAVSPGRPDTKTGAHGVSVSRVGL